MPAPSNQTNLVSKSANYTALQVSDQVIRVTAAATVTLPAASTCSVGQEFAIVNDIASGGLISIAPNGADLVNGANSTLAALTPQFAVTRLVTDGVSRWIVATSSVQPETRMIDWVAGGPAATTAVYTVPNDGTTWQLAAFSARFTTASTSGTATLSVDAAAGAAGSGTAQLTGTVSLSGTANTTVNGTVIASPTTITAGQSLAVVLAGTLTNLAGAVFTVTLKRLT